MTHYVTPVTVADAAYTAGFRGLDIARMVAIAGLESGYDTDAVNKSSGALGLWQILPSAHPWITGQNWKDPVVNARAAFRVYSEAPNPGQITSNKWTTYGSLQYWAVLPGATGYLAQSSIPGVSQASTMGSSAVESGVNSVAPGVQSGIGAVSGAVSGVNAFSTAWATLTNPQTYLRAAYIVVGAGLILTSIGAISAPSVASVTGSIRGAVTGRTKK